MNYVLTGMGGDNFYTVDSMGSLQLYLHTYLLKHKAEFGFSGVELSYDRVFKKLQSCCFFQGKEINDEDELRHIISSVYFGHKLVMIVNHTKLPKQAAPFVILNFLLCGLSESPLTMLPSGWSDGCTTNYLNHGNW